MYIKVNTHILDSLSWSWNGEVLQNGCVRFTGVGRNCGMDPYLKFSVCNLILYDRLSTDAYKLAIILFAEYAKESTWTDKDEGVVVLTINYDKWSRLTGIPRRKASETLRFAVKELSSFYFSNSNPRPIKLLGVVEEPQRIQPFRTVFHPEVIPFIKSAPAIRIPAQVLTVSGRCPAAPRLAVSLGIRWGGRMSNKSHRYNGEPEWAKMTFEHALYSGGIEQYKWDPMIKILAALDASGVEYLFIDESGQISTAELKRKGIRYAVECVKIIYRFNEEENHEKE